MYYVQCWRILYALADVLLLSTFASLALEGVHGGQLGLWDVIT